MMILLAERLERTIKAKIIKLQEELAKL